MGQTIKHGFQEKGKSTLITHALCDELKIHKYKLFQHKWFQDLQEQGNLYLIISYVCSELLEAINH